jgi:hypothetical protein
LFVSLNHQPVMNPNMSAVASFNHLPTEVLGQILNFGAADPQTLCRAACSCKALSEAVIDNENLWKSLYLKRWSFRNMNIPNISRQGYRDRHLRDGRALERLMQVSKAFARKPDYGLGRKCNDPMWIQLSEDADSFDVFRLVARNDDEIKTLYHGISGKITPLVQCLATHLLKAVHYRIVIRNLRAVLTKGGDKHTSETQVLEESMMLLEQSLWTWQDLLASNIRERIPRVQEKLDNLTHLLQMTLDEKGGVECIGAREVVTLLNTLLVDELGFIPTLSNSIFLESSSIEHSMDNETFTPVMLVIICKIILSRVGFRVDILCLDDSGRMALGLPDDQVYSELCDGKWGMTEWNPNTKKPFSPKNILLWMTRNMLAFFINVAEQRPNELSTRLYMNLNWVRLLIDLINRPSTMPLPFQMHKWLTRFEDPAIFYHFNLVTQLRMHQYSKAPFWYMMRFSIQEMLYERRANRNQF